MCEQTEYSYVHLLKSKSEQFETFKNFKQEYENTVPWKLRVLRTDNGLEYCNKDMKSFCAQHGIQCGYCVPDTPEANGKIERLNRTLLEKARTILKTSKFSKGFWSAAILTANYLRNRTACRNLKFKTPFEAMFQREPKLDHIRVFGCKCYPHIKRIQNKFEPTAQDNCYLVGYDHDNIYWIYNSVTQKLFRARDVTFNEKLFIGVDVDADKYVDIEVDVERSQCEINSQYEINSQCEINSQVLETEVDSVQCEVNNS